MTKIKVRLFISLVVSLLFISCNERNTHKRDIAIEETGNVKGIDTTTSNANVASALDEYTQRIIQDKNGNFWFASNGGGVYRYNSTNLIRFNEKDGLCSNYVLNIQEDINRDIWMSSGGHICRFDGKTFTDYTDTVKNIAPGNLQYKKGAIYFGHSKGIYQFDGKSFANFKIHPDSYHPENSNTESLYGLYCWREDNAGNLWFGTFNEGVCRFDGKSFTWFKEKGLSGVAMRSIFQDRMGNMWFGNNGAGLIRYDGKALVNFTEQKGLANPEFVKNHHVPDMPGTLARVFAINEDGNGDLWIGTIDAGVWRYNGQKLVNYTVADGLTSNVIWSIYKDVKGELWFLTGGGGVCKFNTNSFRKVSF